MLEKILLKIPESLRNWLYITRIDRWGKAFASMLIGQAIGIHYSGHFSSAAFIIGFLFTISGSVFVALANDWYDAPVDALKKEMFPNAPVASTVPEGVVSREKIFNGAIISGLITLVVSIIGGIVHGLGDLAGYAMLCAAFFVAYTLPPIKLNYRGFGEIMQLLGLGVALSMFNIYLQARTFYPEGLVQFILPHALFIFALSLAKALDDEVSDQAGGKVTFTTLLGNEKTRYIIQIAMILSVVLYLVFHLINQKFPVYLFLIPALAPIPFMYLAWNKSKFAVTNAFAAIASYEKQIYRAMYAFVIVSVVLLLLK